jgi:hypothetical protein
VADQSDSCHVITPSQIDDGRQTRSYPETGLESSKPTSVRNVSPSSTCDLPPPLAHHSAARETLANREFPHNEQLIGGGGRVAEEPGRTWLCTHGERSEQDNHEFHESSLKRLEGAGVMGSFTAAPSRFPGRRSPRMLVIGFIRHS